MMTRLLESIIGPPDFASMTFQQFEAWLAELIIYSDGQECANCNDGTCGKCCEICWETPPCWCDGRKLTAEEEMALRSEYLSVAHPAVN
jgi:hypothetical protein